MIFREEDASKLWCPMTRVSIIRNGKGILMSANRDISLFVPPNSFNPATDLTKCLGTGCMMWQWVEGGKGDGYCGLGGKL
jgi:hypothetical protein